MNEYSAFGYDNSKQANENVTIKMEITRLADASRKRGPAMRTAPAAAAGAAAESMRVRSWTRKLDCACPCRVTPAPITVAYHLIYATIFCQQRQLDGSRD